jgi:hypothetical protein
MIFEIGNLELLLGDYVGIGDDGKKILNVDKIVRVIADLGILLLNPSFAGC